MARLREGRVLAGHASSCMDTSDGVLATLDQLARINDTGINIEKDLNSLVLPEALATTIPSCAFLAGYHGEYELVFSIPTEQNELFLKEAEALSWTPVPIGKATQGGKVSHRGKAINTKYLRNLVDEVDSDPRRYVESCCWVSALIWPKYYEGESDGEGISRQGILEELYAQVVWRGSYRQIKRNRGRLHSQ